MDGRDARVIASDIAFYEFTNRMPLKFGHEITAGSTLCRATLTVEGEDGRRETGVGETPLAVSWTWPGALTVAERLERMKGFCEALNGAWGSFGVSGHPMEIGHAFIASRLPALLEEENAGREAERRMPWLCALVCSSLFDLALHDAYGRLHGVRAFDAFTAKYMNHDLTHYYPEEYRDMFAGKYPADYFVPPHALPPELPAWHLVGGTDPLEPQDLKGTEPQDGYPVLLRDWIKRDGLDCLKIKLVGNDAEWDYRRIVRVGDIALETGVRNLSADFNCTVKEPAYVIGLLERLAGERPDIYARLLYIEQPFPYEIEKYPIDVRGITAMKPLFLDESAHDWMHVRIGYALGWDGVALKTCKTLTGAILSLCWAREHGMKIMVQDLTNPRLAIIPHALLAQHAGTIMGVEVNSMQFCPDASRDEERVHPGLYRRRGGKISLASLGDTGFGYRLEEIRDKARGKAGEPG